MQIQTPDWVKHSVFYQIFPDRFARGQQPLQRVFDTVPFETWEAEPSLQGYKGGDLWGVIERLDYLKEIGINAIYFTPIFQSASNHRYHTHDYYKVDPLLGGDLALKKLLEEAHQRDMKVVLDGVFNHASRGFFFFHDILENGPYSPWVDWFRIEGWPLVPYDGDRPANYVGWADNRALPAFNHDNPAVKEYIMEIAEYWLKFGIDGWRLDVPFEVKTPGFWQEFRHRVKAVNPDAYIVGEVWVDAREWLDGTQFDGVMNYLFTGPTIAFAAGDRVQMPLVEGPSYEPYPPLDASGYAQKIQHLLAMYPWEIQLTQLNLLASHDTARLLTIANGDIDSVKLSTLLLLTFPGAPSIYYGDEVGLPGGLDPDSRRGFPLESNWNLEILSCHKQLIQVRHNHAALQTGHYEVLYAEGMVYAFARTQGAEAVVVVVNAGTEPAKASLEAVGKRIPSHPHEVVYGNGDASWAGETLTVNLPARSGLIVA